MCTVLVHPTVSSKRHWIIALQQITGRLMVVNANGKVTLVQRKQRAHTDDNGPQAA